MTRSCLADYEPDSQVYMFFPIRKANQSKKNSPALGVVRIRYFLRLQIWRTQLIANLEPKVKHVRMRQKYPQTMRGIACDEERSAPENGPKCLDIKNLIFSKM